MVSTCFFLLVVHFSQSNLDFNIVINVDNTGFHSLNHPYYLDNGQCKYIL